MTHTHTDTLTPNKGLVIKRKIIIDTNIHTIVVERCSYNNGVVIEDSKSNFTEYVSTEFQDLFIEFLKRLPKEKGLDMRPM